MRRLLFSLLLPAIALAICTAAARAQLSVPNIASSPAITGSAIRQEGLFLTAPVTVDGAPVFRIAVQASPAPGMPIDTRILLVQNAISQVLSVSQNGDTVFDPETFKVTVQQEGSQQVLFATDGKHAAPVAIVTVTSNDATYNRMSDGEVAQQWRALLQNALSAALDKRQPDVIKRNARIAAQLGAACALLTVVGVLALSFVGRRTRKLRAIVEAQREEARSALSDTAAGPAQLAAHQRNVFAFALRTLEPENRLRALGSLRSVIWWVVVLAWVAAIIYVLLLFPATAAFGHFALQASGRVVAIWLFAALGDRVLEYGIARFAEAYSRRGFSSEDKARRVLRIPTFTAALGGFKTVIVFFVAAIATLSVLQVPVASVVTIGGVAAVAVGLAAQSLIRDVLGGLLVLLEDQYIVGDSIQIGDYNGIVENLTLRIVQIRDTKGRLITVPHSSVVQVVNMSRNWSRIDYRVAVAPGTDPDAALAVLRDTFEGLRSDQAWSDAIVEPVEWMGVETVWINGIVLRAVMRTAPLRQAEIQRILNVRLMEAFAKAGIKYGMDPDTAPTLSITASPDQL
jgi:small conductance mechanosensitive channel